MSDHLDLLHELYAAISADADTARFWHPDAEQIEYPSLMRPAGHRRPLAEMLAAGELGRQVISGQHYDVHTAIEAGDRAAVQLTWTATVAKDLPGVPAGTRLRAHVAAFYEFRDGLVLRQSSYDCYEPLGGAR
jgi:ketosteroid isomerase-like protein